MAYVDGFLLPVARKNLKSYQKMAKEAGKVWKKHGALEYFECVGDDLFPKMGEHKIARFPKVAKAKTSETVIFSFIVYQSKAHRNRVNAKVMKEMEKDMEKHKQMPFDIRRMAYGGFKTIVKM